jgi:ABC-type multidrug transport system ATPase subunit
MTEPILQTFQLHKEFDGVTAVDTLNLSIHAGELFGFLGPNGAGKTTTMSMILGLTPPTSGRISLFGAPLTPQRTRPLRRVGALVGAPALIPYLSGRENLQLLARVHPDVTPARIEAVLTRVGMRAAAGRPYKSCSTGMKQRLGLAAALLHEPELLLLDEPTNGLDPAGMREIRELLRQLAGDGITIFLSSHLLHEVEQICDRIGVIHHGRLIADGPVSELLDGSQDLESLFLELTAAA